MSGYVYSEDVLHDAWGHEMKPAKASQKPLPSIQQQLIVLMNLTRAGDPITKQQIIARNLSLVVSIADHYSYHGVELLDLVNEGIQGLIHALENFEREGGFRFAAYAARCVRQNIERAAMNRNNHLSFVAFHGS